MHPASLPGGGNVFLQPPAEPRIHDLEDFGVI